MRYYFKIFLLACLMSFIGKLEAQNCPQDISPNDNNFVVETAAPTCAGGSYTFSLAPGATGDYAGFTYLVNGVVTATAGPGGFNSYTITPGPQQYVVGFVFYMNCTSYIQNGDGSCTANTFSCNENPKYYTIPVNNYGTTAKIVSLTQPSGYNCNNGQVIVQVYSYGCNGWVSSYTGKTGPFNTYTQDTISNLAPGNYTFYYTSASPGSGINTIDSVEATIVQPPCTISANYTVSNVSSFAGDDGQISVRVTTSDCKGYYSPFTNQLMPSGSTETLPMKVAGEYGFTTVSGSNACSTTDTFYITQPTKVLPLAPLKTAEYFIDTDPGVGNGTAFTLPKTDSANILQNVVIPKTIAGGYHKLYFRVKDSLNHWGLYEPRNFYVDTFKAPQQTITYLPPLKTAEYFIDTDPGVGNGTAFTLPKTDSANISQNVVIPKTTARGYHKLYFRVKDSLNHWGLYEPRNFYVDTFKAPQQTITYVPPLTGGEYFFNTDSGVGKGVPFLLKKGDSINTTFSTIIPVLKTGSNIISVRVKDSLGRWSLPLSQSFTAYPLPVFYVSINAFVNDQGILTNWQTTNEINTSNFIVQHSIDGTSFKTIGSVNAKGSGANSYEFTDMHPANGINYYRLESVDKDGASTFSKVVSVDFTVNSNQLQSIQTQAGIL